MLAPPVGIDLGRVPPGLRSMTIGDVQRSMEDLGLWGFPRRFGTPHDRVLPTPVAFEHWWTTNWGKMVPMYAGHNAYVADGKGREVRDRMVFETAFGDMDNGNGSGITSADLRREVQEASRWLVARDIPHAWKVSGGDPHTEDNQGYHLRIRFDEQEQPRSYLTRWESAFWRGFAHELNLKSLNLQCANPIHMERLPYTPHVHNKDPKHPGQFVFDGTYCVPVPWDWVFEGKWESIRELTISPQTFARVRYAGSTTPLEAFVRQMGWTTFGHEPGAFHPFPELAPLTGAAHEWNRAYVPAKLCLQTLPFTSNPRHAVRFAWAVEVLNQQIWDPVQKKLVPMSLEEGINLCEAIGREAGWIDFNPEVIRRQMTHAYERIHGVNEDTRYRPYSCHTLRETSLCVEGAVARCPLFPKAFPQEYALYRASHPEVG